jgi:prolyl 4-hydroxylase
MASFPFNKCNACSISILHFLHQRLRLWDKTSLSYRRLEELFFSNKNIPRTIGHYTLSLIHDSPNIYTIDNFLNQKDLAFLQRAATTRTFEPSFVDDPSTNQSFAQDDHRTSTFVSFQKQENAHVASLEHRAASLLGCFTTRSVEALQLVRYEAGQFFGVHHDLGDYNDATVALPPKQLFCSRRLVTIFVYVNDVESGGETWFPRANVKVVPRAGRAVVWQNVLANGEPDVRTIHAGLVVNKGVKYGLNMWLTEA